MSCPRTQQQNELWEERKSNRQPSGYKTTALSHCAPNTIYIIYNTIVLLYYTISYYTISHVSLFILRLVSLVTICILHMLHLLHLCSNICSINKKENINTVEDHCVLEGCMCGIRETYTVWHRIQVCVCGVLQTSHPDRDRFPMLCLFGNGKLKLSDPLHMKIWRNNLFREYPHESHPAYPY